MSHAAEPARVESPIYFESEGRRVFGVLHEPAGRPARPAIVFCAALAEEKLWAHRVFVNLARDFAERGFPVLRFDTWGEGDSEGDFEQATLATRVADAGAAARLLRERQPQATAVGWLGLRLGATIAALAAERDHSKGPLVLCEPVISGADYVQELLRINLATQLAVHKEIRRNRQVLVAAMHAGATVNVDGYELTGSFHDELSTLDLRHGPRAHDAPVLIVAIARTDGPPPVPHGELAALYRSARVQTVREEPFWKELRAYVARAERLSASTLEFFEEFADGRRAR